jgi:predicted nucleic acid-binding Zn ribbon protein
MRIGSILEANRKEWRREADTGMTRIWEIWEEAVGSSVSENARPAVFKGKVLVVKVSSSAWIQHLTFSKRSLMKKINDAMGSEMVREIRFKIGNV